MKTNFRFLGALILLSGLFLNNYGQGIVLTQSNESGIYKKGEAITITASLNEIEADSLAVSIRINFGKDVQKEKMLLSGDKVVVYSGAFEEPSSLVCDVRVGGKKASLGLVVDPENLIPGTKRPKDFDSFWKNEKKALRALAIEVKTVPLDDTEAGYSCLDVEINCTGPKPARGYFAKPEGAAEGSLPIVLMVHAAGVKGSWCLSKPGDAMRYAKMGQGALCFDLNAHGMLNGQPQEYYDDLEAGELKNYYYQGMESRDEYYFKGMYLRLIRTLDFLCSQPEWDGKRIIVIGESQGGGQALAAAGLDSRVTAAVATVPAMCDMGGPVVGRQGGWPNAIGYNMGNQKILEAVTYFDTAHLLKNSKATLVTEIGLVDMTCPSTSIYAAINQAKGDKITYAVPYRGHQLSQRSFQRTWEQTVYDPKMEFIADFLR